VDRSGPTAAVPSFDGEVRFDEPTLDAAADDFGHVVRRTPTAVLRPTSVRDVAGALRWAGRLGHRVAPRGQGHSVWGRSQVDHGLVIDMSTLRSVHPVQGDRVVVDAGARWSDVLAATLPDGLTPPVLTDYLDLSIGGTLAVGGVGATTARYGMQSDNVVELDVVTGRGDVVTCSAERHPDLFDAVRAGLGQLGVIARATLALVPAPGSVWRVLMFYPHLGAMRRDARRLADDTRLDAVQGAVLFDPTSGWTFRLDAAAFITGSARDAPTLPDGLGDDPTRRQSTTMSYVDYVNRLAPFEAALRASGQWSSPHPWLATFIGDSTVEQLVGAELGRLDPAVDLGQFGQVVLSPIRRAAVTSPMVRLPTEALCYAFNLIRVPPSDHIDATNQLVERNRGVYERVRDAGGTLYPVSALSLSPADWRHHLGPVYDGLARAKRAYDPLGILTPGYEVFDGRSDPG
jgi:cytokinin dehydrogenase